MTANVVGLITGVTQESGFKGSGGRFDRRHLLSFGTDKNAEIRFTRADYGSAVEVSANLASVPMDPQVRRLLPRCLAGEADAGEIEASHRLWQGRVKSLLLDHKDDRAVFTAALV